MNLLVVGTLAYDSVETPFGKRDNILGGSASYAAVCASYFCPVQMVGIVGRDFNEEHLAFFRGKGIDTNGVEHASGQTFRWSGRYEENMNIRHTLVTELNVLEQFKPAVPASFRDTPYLILGNFDPSLQLSVLDQMTSPRLVACDTMNFWIDGYREALDRTLARVDVLLVNDSEARELSGEHNLLKAARGVRAMGPSLIVIKLGEHGAMLLDDEGLFLAPAFVLEQIMDPTGAGDSFAGGMMGFLARQDRWDSKTLRQAMVLGTVMASFSVQDFSIDSVRDLNTSNIEARVAEFRDLTQVSLDGTRLE
ncbi:PfkB family carbohydrate kinase [Myxococcota bacterium]